MYQNQFQQPVHGFVYVNGIEGARAYQMPPNSEMPLFDANGDVMFVKVTDAAGYPTITVVDCKRRDDVTAPSVYVTQDEMRRVYSDISGQIEQIKEALNGIVPKASASGQPHAGAAARQPAADVPAAR